MKPFLLLAEEEFSNGTNCSDGIYWIWHHMNECVENDVQMAGFVIGFVSLVLWLVPLIPQLYENYRLQSAEGLSIYFLLFWIAGDTLNMAGAVLTNQLEFQIYIGIYYIFQDFCLISQFIYYTSKSRAASKALSEEVVDSPSSTLSVLMFFGSVGTFLSSYREKRQAVVVPGQRKLLRFHFFHGASDETGYVIGSLSALSYFGGRVPQILKNYRRKSTEGVSVAMFVIIIAGNLTYGLSVLFQGWGGGWFFVLRHFPWLVGSLGCCFLDIIVLMQAFHYSKPAESDTANLIEA